MPGGVVWNWKSCRLVCSMYSPLLRQALDVELTIVALSDSCCTMGEPRETTLLHDEFVTARIWQPASQSLRVRCY